MSMRISLIHHLQIDDPTASPQFHNSTDEPDDEPHFEPGDPDNPRNWPEWRNWSIVIAVTLIDLSVSWGALGYTPAEKEMEAEFGVSAEVGTLGLSLYILGLALSPMTLAPLSEVRSIICILNRDEGHQLMTSSTSDEVHYISFHMEYFSSFS